MRSFQWSEYTEVMIADARITNEALHSEGFIYSDTGVRPFSDDSDSTSDLLVIHPKQSQALGKNLATWRLIGTKTARSQPSQRDRL